tara:strand:+ start:5463 stop:6158 length:696 start_codon:yes stop_codon:yes gene_type:complete
MIFRAIILLILWVNMLVDKRNVHQRWEDQLQRYVNPRGVVNYRDWKKETHALKSYLKALEDHPPQPYWTTTNRKAYWINVYNAATIALVLDHHPLQSIKDIDAPWVTSVFRLGDQSMSLKAIEGLLLEMEDPRILFTLHRATVSSPDLSRQPYRSGTLEEQLQTAAIKFLKDPSLNQCHKYKSHMSPIFLWYFKDFGSLEQRVTLLQKYGCTEVNQKTKFRYLPFDWQLNE